MCWLCWISVDEGIERMLDVDLEQIWPNLIETSSLSVSVAFHSSFDKNMFVSV